MEPNSGLGHAIAYMLKHWQKLTLFLRRRGSAVTLVAPLYHPLSYQALLATDEIEDLLERLDRHLDVVAGRTGSTFVNLRRNHSALCEGSEFLDGHHPGPGFLGAAARQLG